MCTIICIIWLKVDENEQFHPINVIHRGHILGYVRCKTHQSRHILMNHCPGGRVGIGKGESGHIGTVDREER